MLKAKEIRIGSMEYTHRINAKSTESLNTRHCHDTYEILFVVRGRGRYLIEGAEFKLGPRTLALINPLRYHCVEVDLSEPYERYVLHFPESFLVKEVRALLARFSDVEEGESGSFFASDMLSGAIISLFDRFEQGEELCEAERETYYRLLLSELILLLSGTKKEKIVHYGYDLGAKVAKYINAYLDKNISLDEIAGKFFVSKYYLCRTFKKYSGVSIHAYINHKRVMFAKQLIDSGETASGAAYKVGFGDYSAFYRAYVKALGKPPTSKK